MTPHDLISERFTLWLLCINFVPLNDVFRTKWQHPYVQTYNSMGDIFAHFNIEYKLCIWNHSLTAWQ